MGIVIILIVHRVIHEPKYKFLNYHDYHDISNLYSSGYSNNSNVIGLF